VGTRRSVCVIIQTLCVHGLEQDSRLLRRNKTLEFVILFSFLGLVRAFFFVNAASSLLPGALPSKWHCFALIN